MHYVTIIAANTHYQGSVMHASCSCGWRGTWQETKEDAEEQGIVHVQEESE